MSWLSEGLNSYHNWLRSNTTVLQDAGGDWAAIQTPYSGIYNDLLKIYVRKSEDTIYLSDDGETLEHLALLGINFDSKGHRQQISEQILRNYGLRIDANGELVSQATMANFPQQKHNFLSAMLEFHDLHTLSKHSVASIFKEDVRHFLEEKDIVFTPDFISRGKTGLEFVFDFQIAGRKEEIVVKAFNTMNKQTLTTFLFGWDDIVPVREQTTKKTVRAIAFVNDVERPVKPEFKEAMKQRNTALILWSERNSNNLNGLLRAA